MRIFVATEPADFRRGIDGLAALCRQRLEQDPMNGCAFVFRNRRGTAIKILLYDGQGFWLCQKKLETEDTQIFVFTEIGRLAHNRHVGIAEACRMVAISHRSSSRR
jgi:IS66 Orf2 like protein